MLKSNTFDLLCLLHKLVITLKKKNLYFLNIFLSEKQLQVDCIGSHPTLKAAHSNFCVLYEARDLNIVSFIHFIAF